MSRWEGLAEWGRHFGLGQVQRLGVSSVSVGRWEGLGEWGRHFGLTQEQFGRRLDVSRMSVRWEGLAEWGEHFRLAQDQLGGRLGASSVSVSRANLDALTAIAKVLGIHVIHVSDLFRDPEATGGGR
jgi:hypothetical protein